MLHNSQLSRAIPSQQKSLSQLTSPLPQSKHMDFNLPASNRSSSTTTPCHDSNSITSNTQHIYKPASSIPFANTTHPSNPSRRSGFVLDASTSSSTSQQHQQQQQQQQHLEHHSIPMNPSFDARGMLITGMEAHDVIVNFKRHLQEKWRKNRAKQHVNKIIHYHVQHTFFLRNAAPLFLTDYQDLLSNNIAKEANNSGVNNPNISGQSSHNSSNNSNKINSAGSSSSSSNVREQGLIATLKQINTDVLNGNSKTKSIDVLESYLQKLESRGLLSEFLDVLIYIIFGENPPQIPAELNEGKKNLFHYISPIIAFLIIFYIHVEKKPSTLDELVTRSGLKQLYKSVCKDVSTGSDDESNQNKVNHNDNNINSSTPGNAAAAASASAGRSRPSSKTRRNVSSSSRSSSTSIYRPKGSVTKTHTSSRMEGESDSDNDDHDLDEEHVHNNNNDEDENADDDDDDDDDDDGTLVAGENYDHDQNIDEEDEQEFTKGGNDKHHNNSHHRNHIIRDKQQSAASFLANNEESAISSSSRGGSHHNNSVARRNSIGITATPPVVATTTQSFLDLEKTISQQKHQLEFNLARGGPIHPIQEHM